MKMRKQRHMGAALVVLSWLILLLAATGATPIDQDATAAVLLLPPGALHDLHGAVYFVPLTPTGAGI